MSTAWAGWAGGLGPVGARAWAPVGQLRGLGPTQWVGARGFANPNSAFGGARMAASGDDEVVSPFAADEVETKVGRKEIPFTVEGVDTVLDSVRPYLIAGNALRPPARAAAHLSFAELGVLCRARAGPAEHASFGDGRTRRGSRSSVRVAAQVARNMYCIRRCNATFFWNLILPFCMCLQMEETAGFWRWTKQQEWFRWKWRCE